MTKDQLIAQQALKIANLEEQIKTQNDTIACQAEKIMATTKALKLSEFASIQTITDRIEAWGVRAGV